MIPFTYNLYQQVENLGCKTIIRKHDEINIEDIKKIKPEKIIISPGPKSPKNAGTSKETIRYFYD